MSDSKVVDGFAAAATKNEEFLAQHDNSTEFTDVPDGTKDC